MDRWDTMEKRKHAPNWWLLGFVGGAGTGGILGLFTADIWGGPGPYRTQIWTGLFGLIGAGLGILIGLTYQVLNAHRNR
jgi:hypothetical protein